MTPRRSVDLDVPALAAEADVPLPANVRQFPFIIGPHIVLEMAERQRKRSTEKAVARRARRRGRRP